VTRGFENEVNFNKCYPNQVYSYVSRLDKTIVPTIQNESMIYQVALYIWDQIDKDKKRKEEEQKKKYTYHRQKSFANHSFYDKFTID